MISCEQARELLDLYALGAAEPEERTALEGHLAGCAACTALLDEAREVVGMLAFASPLRQPSPALRERVLAQIGASPAGSASMRVLTPPQSLPRSIPRPRRRRWLQRALAVAAVLVLAVAVGGTAAAVMLFNRVDDLEGRNETLVREMDTFHSMAERVRVLEQTNQGLQQANQELERQRSALAVLSAPDATRIRLDSLEPGSGSAYYYWSRSNRLGVFMSMNLPPPPEGKAYKVWMNRSGQAEDVGTVEIYPNNIGLAIVPLRGGESISGMAVTLESVQRPEPSGRVTVMAVASSTPEPMR